MAFTASKNEVGTNTVMEVSAKGILTITVDLTKEFGMSASGKTKIIASTKGNVSVDGGGGAIVGFNCYRK